MLGGSPERNLADRAGSGSTRGGFNPPTVLGTGEPPVPPGETALVGPAARGGTGGSPVLHPQAAAGTELSSGARMVALHGGSGSSANPRPSTSTFRASPSWDPHHTLRSSGIATSDRSLDLIALPATGSRSATCDQAACPATRGILEKNATSWRSPPGGGCHGLSSTRGASAQPFPRGSSSTRGSRVPTEAPFLKLVRALSGGEDRGVAKKSNKPLVGSRRSLYTVHNSCQDDPISRPR
jgi:hypothetical protein